MRTNGMSIRISLCLALAAVGWGDGPPGTNHQTQQATPIKLGTSGGNINDISRAFCCSGTLGALVDISGTKYVLSNNHVLALTNQGSVGDDIIHAGLIDQTPVCSQDTNDTVADLTSFISISFVQGMSIPSNTVDAAIAQIVAGKVETSGEILDVGTPSTTTLAPSLGLSVKKAGRTTGETAGTIDSVDVDVLVFYQDECGKGRRRRALFTDQFGVSPGAFAAFGSGGDSGSLIVENCSPRPKPVGLLFAGGGSVTFANPIGAVLASFPGSSIVGSTDTACTSVAGFAAPAGSTITDGLARAVGRVKDRYRDFLFSLPEVVGHGVGLSRSRPGEIVIQLFVRQVNENARRAAPSAIEGVRVELVETGEIFALPACGPGTGPSKF